MGFIAALINAIVFSVIGTVVFGISFYVSDKLTPVDLWKGIVEDKNIALAIVSGSVAIAIGLIVAASIHS